MHQPPPRQDQRNEECGQQHHQRAGLADGMLQSRQLPPEPIPQAAEQQSPADPPARVVEREAAVGHPGDAGQQGGEHAEQRHEAAEEDRLAAVPPEEVLGTLELGVVDAEEPAIPPYQGEPAGSPDPVRSGIAQHGADCRSGDDARDREVAGGGVR